MADFHSYQYRPVNWRVTLLFLLTAAILTLLVAYLNPPFNPETYCCDHLFYRSMAFNLFKVTRPEFNKIPEGNTLWGYYDDPFFTKFFHRSNGLNRQPPYIYRIITPLVARAIGKLFFHDDVHYGFYTLSFLSLTMTSFLISLILYLLTDNVMASVLGSFAFSFFKWTSAFNLYDYMLTDPLAFFFNCTAILLILRRRQFSFFLVCLLGLFNKISMVGVIPCYLLRELLERKLKISSVVSAVSVIMIYLVFRTNMPAPVKTYSLITVFTGIPRWQSLVVLNLSVFGILTFFTVSRMWLSKFTLSLAPLAMMSLISTLFICDKQRGIIYAFPLVLISVLGIRMETRKGRILTIAPIFTYFLVEIIQERLHIRAKPLFFIEFGIFVVLEAAFLCEYFKDNPKFKAIIAQVNSVRKGGSRYKVFCNRTGL